MSPAKRFLIIYAVVYLVIALALVVTLGPPGYSSDYLEKYKGAEDRYLTIVKSDGYKLYKEHPTEEGKQALGEALEFVAAHEALPEWQAETRRRFVFGTLFDFFNAAAVIVLAVRFGGRPFLNFLDEKIDAVRTRMDKAAQAKSAAAKHRADAQAKVDNIRAEQEELAALSQEQMAEDRTAIEESTAHGFEQIDLETEDRKNLEERRAAFQLRQELVYRAIDLLKAQSREAASSETQAAQIDLFVQGLEKRS